MPTPLHRLVLAGLCLALLGACRSSRGAYFFSDPPGARVVVDGRDTGFVTPCVMELKNKRRREVSFELTGYETAKRTLVVANRYSSIFWKDATVYYNTWRFPLWLNTEDFFLPIKLTRGELPNRVFVRLRRQADRRPPLGAG